MSTNVAKRIKLLIHRIVLELICTHLNFYTTKFVLLICLHLVYLNDVLFDGDSGNRTIVVSGTNMADENGLGLLDAEGDGFGFSNGSGEVKR